MDQVEYGNWVPLKMIATVVAAVAVFFIPALILGRGVLSYLFWALAALSAAAAAYLVLARWALSRNNGEIQTRIRDLVLANLEWDGQGRVLDIGCGNGPLSLALAREHPRARVTGVDYWSGMWDYSLKACRDNARAEGLEERVSFEKADAGNLPFEDQSFEAAVSNFVFHEVKRVKDKREVLQEALRVVKDGGAFSFQDLFQVKRCYGDLDSLLQELRDSGIREVRFTDTTRAEFIPAYLKAFFMLGSIGIIHGRK